MRRLNFKKISIWALPVLLVIGLSLFLLDKYSVIDLPFIGQPVSTVKDGVDYRPPTETEKRETDDFKKNLPGAPVEDTPTSTPGKKTSVVVTLASWGQSPQTNDVDATGTVSGEISDTGTCTLTMTKGSVNVSESRSSTANAQGSSCGRIVVPYSKLAPGTWDIQLSYSSETAEGSSSVTKLEVR